MEHCGLIALNCGSGWIEVDGIFIEISLLHHYVALFVDGMFREIGNQVL